MELKAQLQPLLVLIFGFSFVTAEIDYCWNHTVKNGYLDIPKNVNYSWLRDRIICNNGYNLLGDKYVTCNPNGTVSSNSTCKIKDCGSEYSLTDGYVNFTARETTFNHTVPVACDLGYEPHGEHYITCLADGTWSNDTSCNLIDCGNNDDFSNGYVNWTGRETTFNSSVPVFCKDGYEIHGHHAITCLSDGNWSTDASCQFKASSEKFNLTIPIATGGIFVVGVIACVVIILYFKRWRKTCFTKTVEQPQFEQLEMELKVWSKFRPAVVKLADFRSYTEDLHKDKNKMFSDGFKLLNEQSPSHPTTVAETQACRPKTRYTNILPFDHSRVTLTPMDEVEGSDFIDANYIPGYKSPKEYIATQTPLPETKKDFWRMVWEQNVDIIVMLTKRSETRKISLPKNYSVERHGTASTFDQYWPDKVQVPVYYGDLEVNTISESVLSHNITRVMEVKLGTETRIVTQIHFRKWPDHGCPRRTWPFINFVTMVRQYKPQQMIVQCSTGVSRTGTFIAVDRLLQHVKHHDDVDIYSLILDMRNYRCNMVKTEEQFIFIYECIRHYITTEEDFEDEKGETRSNAHTAKGPSFYSNIAFQGEGTC